MTTIPARACRRCKKRTTTPGGLCDACRVRSDKIKSKSKQQYIKTYDSSRGTSASRGYDRDWRSLRTQQLESFPLCAMCSSSGIITAAQMVHHIKPVSKYPNLRLHPNNLMSLCNKCHEIIEQRASAIRLNMGGYVKGVLKGGIHLGEYVD